MKTLVWFVALVVVASLGCEKRDTRVTGPSAGGTPDIVTEEAGITAEFYNSENPVTGERLETVAGMADVRSALGRFEEMGYVLDESNSFVVRGRGPDGSPVDLTLFAMGHTARPHRDAVYLIHLDCEEGRVVVPLRISFVKAGPGADALQIGESVWLEWIDPPLAAGPVGRAKTSAGAPPPEELLAAKMSIYQWLECVGRQVAAGAVACAMVCRFTPVSYLQCMATCTAGHLVYALVACSIQAL